VSRSRPHGERERHERSLEEASIVDVSVVVPVRNGAAELRHQLHALSRQEWSGSWEVVIVDNGSTDGTREVGESFVSMLPRLRVVDASNGIGHAHAVNCGIAAAGGDAILFVDADDEVAPGYLDAMAGALERHPFVAARLDDDALNEPWCRQSRPAAQAEGLGRPFGFLATAAGCSLGIRRSVIERVGCFDATLPVCDDIDFCWRAQLEGVELTFVQDAIVRYRYRDTFRGIFEQGLGYGRAGPLLYRRYRGLGMPRRSWRSVGRFWLGSLSRLMLARSKGDFAEVTFLLGYRLGILQGCWRSRVLYL
jgi:GT2 family glycosyltransferase